MARRTAPNLSAEDLASLERLRRAAAEAETLPPPSPELQAIMDAEARASGALMVPGPARDAYQNVNRMPREQFEREFADVLNSNADEDILEGDDGAE